MLGFDDVQHPGRLEQPRHDQPAAELHGAQRQQPTTGGVEERHDIEDRLALPQAHPRHRETRIVGDAAMVQHHALRKAGGAGGVLNLRRIAGADLGQGGRGRLAGVERRGVLKIDDLAHGADLRRHLAGDLGHRVAAMLLDDEQANGAGLLQDILQLARSVGRIGGD